MDHSLNAKELEILAGLLRQCGKDLGHLCPLRGDGSTRRFLRVFSKDQEVFILICPQPGAWGLKEAQAYVKIGRFLRGQGVRVPSILAFDEESGFVLVEDLGALHLQDLPPAQRAYFYPRVIELLVHFQRAGEAFDPEITLETPFYDLGLMWEKEALYFLGSFVQGYLGLSPGEELIEELRQVCVQAAQHFTDTVLLHRDFQSRNIMLFRGEPYLIDFQGARLGPPAYDLASLLIDPYVSLSPEEKTQYVDIYLRLTGRAKEAFYREFVYLCLMRNLQILGAFAKLQAQGKSWFADYIPPALNHLRDWVEIHFPALKALRKLLRRISG